MHFRGPRNTRGGIPSCSSIELRFLQTSPFGKRHRTRSGHDEMVENLHIHQCQGLLEALRKEELIGAARSATPDGMVVR